jgi:4'-phosphopantetheinyl transferase EntD
VNAPSAETAPDLDCAPLRAAVAGLAPPDVAIGCTAIRPADATCLLPEERRSLTTRDAAALRASGAARRLARGLFVRLGFPETAIGRGPSGAPVWPWGLTGSLAHDDAVAVAAVARASGIRSRGIDVEPAAPLPEDLLPLVVTAADRTGGLDSALWARLLFAAKEAVYKAAHPLDGLILDFDDIAVDFPAAQARTRTGHRMRLAWCTAPRIVTLALVAWE